MNQITDEYEGTLTTGCGSVTSIGNITLSVGTTTTGTFPNDARLTTGICGLCGGEVSEPQVIYTPDFSGRRGESCDKCGAVTAPPELPVLKMVKP